MGESIVYKYENDPTTLVLQRVIESKFIGNSIVFVTKADSESLVNKIPVTENEILGKVIIVIPKVGNSENLKHLILFVYFFVGLAIGIEIKKIVFHWSTNR